MPRLASLKRPLGLPRRLASLRRPWAKLTCWNATSNSSNSSKVASRTTSGTKRMTKKIEVWAALLLTVIITLFHGLRLTKAGALWRDEAGAVQLATLQSFKDTAANFPHEAFPLLFPATLRTYCLVAGAGDTAWRVFGMLVGL